MAPLSWKIRLEFEAVGVERVSVSLPFYPLLEPHVNSPPKNAPSSKLALNVIQRFCHSQCTKERSSRKCLPQSDCQSVPILRIMKMREALKILSLQLFSSRAISSYVSSKLSESPWKSVWQDWHAVIKPRWSWITHTGPMAGSQNSPPQGCLALQQNTLTSAISHRIGIPKTHQTRSTVYWHWVVSETEFKMLVVL